MWFKYSENENIFKSEYIDLNPVNNIENGEEYLKALGWALKNPRIRNIAIAGPYGSGKSSIIETFLEKNKDNCSKFRWICKNILKNKYFSKKYLKISIATFIQSKENSKIALNAHEVEEGILKQLFYKVDYRKIPQSRYRKIKKVSFFRSLLGTFTLSVFLLLLSRIFIPTLYNDVWSKFSAFAAECNLPSYTAGWMTIITWIIMIIIVSLLWRGVISKYQVKEIKLPVDTKIERQDKEEINGSIFNKNLDEIMYFFESTPYRIIFFEDLDRIQKDEIFVHLRELNNLLNNADTIKDKPIVFVYAVRDDLFTKEDRTKFFDFIIPVIPVINSTNSGEVLLEWVKVANLKGTNYAISQDFIFDIAPFIGDMRILQNICNEFIIYKNIVCVKQALALSDEEMMAMVIFKNLYPSDFADIQMEKGILKQAFNDKHSYISKKKMELQWEIDHIGETIEKAETDVLTSVRELKYAMLLEITKGEGLVKSFKAQKYGATSFSMQQILEDKFNLRQLESSDCEYAEYINEENRVVAIHKNQFWDILLHYIERWETRSEYNKKGLAELQKKIKFLNEEIQNLSGKSLKDILQDHESQEILSDNVRSNDFVVFLLRRGYINEKYKNYINYFKGNSITIDDMNFILSVKNQNPLPFEYILTKSDVIIQRLQDYEFKQRSVYNFQLIEQMLNEKGESTKLNNVICQLSDEDITSWKFIDQFVNITQNQKRFIKMLSQKWMRMWKYIFENSTLTYERKLDYMVLLLDIFDCSEIANLNVDKCITTFFETHADILQRLNQIEVEKLKSVILSLDIKFKDLFVDNVEKSLITFIFDNCQYELNEKMVQYVVEYRDPGRIYELERRPYSLIVDLNYDPMLQYVKDNIQCYVANLMMRKEEISDDIKDILEIIQSLRTQNKLCYELIKRENFCLDNLFNCMGEIIEDNNKEVEIVWNMLLEVGKVLASWENILIYWSYYGISDYIKIFIESHINCLIADSDKSGLNDRFIMDFIRGEFNESTFEKLLPLMPMQEFGLDFPNIKEQSLKAMIKCRYFEFNVDYYARILTVYPDIAVEYIIENQCDFIASLDSFEMDSDLFERLFFENRITKVTKNILFHRYAVGYMTERIAANMNKQDVSVTKKEFESAWDHLPFEKKEQLMFNNLDILDSDMVEKCFRDLGGIYSQMIERSKRRDVKLEKSTKFEKLVTHLEEIEYITSWNIVTVENSSSDLESSNYDIIICRIKKKK